MTKLILFHYFKTNPDIIRQLMTMRLGRDIPRTYQEGSQSKDLAPRADPSDLVDCWLTDVLKIHGSTSVKDKTWLTIRGRSLPSDGRTGLF
jgi:hypothetical protein